LERVTVARLDRVEHGSSGYSRDADPDWRGSAHALPQTPWPANVTASDRGRVVLDLLFEWADFVAQWHGVTGLPVFARHVPLGQLVPQAVAMLLSRADWMRHNEQGPVLAEAIHQVRRDMRRLVDMRPARLYAGPCRADLDYPPELGYVCQVPLFRKWGSDEIVCDGHQPQPRPASWYPTGCGAVHAAADRDEFTHAAVEEHLLPLRLLWESLYKLEPTAAAVEWRTVQQWTRPREQRIPIRDKQGRPRFDRRGREMVRIHTTPARLEPAGVDWQGRPLYRGSDVLRLARDDRTRRGRRRVQRVNVA
jgi:hypothetical protein